MKIKELFSKPVDREIDGVIKASDDRKLATELEEYVITREVEKGLTHFIERYLAEKGNNGVWISGFFGSGKSHLLKILSLMLDSTREVGGKRPSDYIIAKVDDLMKQDLRRVCAIPSRSILFNIDEKAYGIGGDNNAPILEVFIKVMNELQGYFPKQGYIADFEYQLDRAGKLESFKKAFQDESGTAWDTDREFIATTKRKPFLKAYAKEFGYTEEQAATTIDTLRREYRVSIDGFSERVKAYIDKQAPGFRLNFFVDEVGQFIGNNASRMLNLQTVAESLAAKCNGQAWIFVTSQASLEGLIGNFKDANAEQISKIQGRFKTKLTLASSDVKEVIQKRLLAKKEAEPAALTAVYDAEKENMRTIFTFGDRSVEFPTWRGSDEFCNLYPFHNYQFDLFQLALKELSDHDAFTGRFHSVGERSMLSVFQDVAKVVMTDDVGRLATFDQMFDGVKPSIRAELHLMIDQAGKMYGNGLEARILKALFLLKWVAQFKATKRNIAVLLIDSPKVNISQHVADVEAALVKLEAASFIQRNGEEYQYLTNVEIDIEKEIKNTTVTDAELSKQIADIFITDILGSPKIRYLQNGQDFAFGKKVNGASVDGQDGNAISLNVVTPDHPFASNPSAIVIQNSAAPDLMINAVEATRLIDQVRAYLRTRRYTNTNSSVGDPNKADAIKIRQKQNGERANLIKDMVKELLGKCELYVGGNKLGLGSGDAKTRLLGAAQELITHTYRKLQMVPGQHDESSLRKALTERDDLLSGGAIPLTEAENEVWSYAERRIREGARLSATDIVEHFSRTPFGWSRFATLTQIARLMRMGKFELRVGPTLLDGRGAAEDLSSNSKAANVIIQLQVAYPPDKVNALKKFHQEFFGRATQGNEGRIVANELIEGLKAEHKELEKLIAERGSYYAFLSELKGISGKICEVADRDASFIVNNLSEYGETLLAAKEELINPIKAFMNGAQLATYDAVVKFYNEQRVNLAELPVEDLAPIKALVDSKKPYAGLTLRDAKTARDTAQVRIESLLKAAKDDASETLDALESGLKDVPEFSKLGDDQKKQVTGMSGEIRQKIKEEGFIAAVKQHAQAYKERIHPQQLDRVMRLANPPKDPTPDGKNPVPPPAVPTYVGFREIMQGKEQALINDQAELEAWIKDFRDRATAEISKGKRIRIG